MSLKARRGETSGFPTQRHHQWHSGVGRVLAERNQAVVPVGAWVESARDCSEEHSPAFISALEVDKQLKEIHKAKMENLKRFQDEVKQRVTAYAQIHKKHQRQRTCEAVEKDDRVIIQSSASADQLVPNKNTCLLRGNDVGFAIFSPSSRWVSAQGLSNEKEDEDVFNDQARQLSKVTKEARHRLASCQIVPEMDLDSSLPGGIWKVSPTRDNPASQMGRELGVTDVTCLKDQHDLPAELQKQPQKSTGGKHVTLEPELQHEKRGSQYMMYRRLFMDIEREQVKEQQRQQQHLKRIAKIKEEKEKLRKAQEKRMIEHTHQREFVTESVRTVHLKEEETQKRADKDKSQRNRESTRYIEALRAQMMEKIKLWNTDLPPLCCCGSDFWDSHPDKCANNCVFYKNPKGYSKALQSVLSSYDAWDEHYRNRSSMKKLALMNLCLAKK
ncbi:coiled-coil domain-containing protein 15 isoform X2 [Mobula hypostoma]|uniref:coiled-coil domain-containing protein 15 isoform X2 n=1 Tax=Mobula hypostoma TaxID=723540 RepID=UPI002FC3ADCA